LLGGEAGDDSSRDALSAAVKLWKDETISRLATALNGSFRRAPWACHIVAARMSLMPVFSRHESDAATEKPLKQGK
jgi:hypothetical protein